MEEIAQEIKTIMEEVEKTKAQVSSDTGKKEITMQALDKLGLSSVTEGRKEIASLEEEKGTKEIEIKKEFKTLQESYEWN